MLVKEKGAAVRALVEIMRRVARWGKDIPLEPETREKLIKKLAATYGPTKVRRAVLVCPVAVEKVIDNEEDARTTLGNLERHEKKRGRKVSG